MEALVPFSDLRISLHDVYEAMGYGDTEPGDTVVSLVKNLLEEAERRTKPLFCYQIADCAILPEQIRVEDKLFDTGKIIARSLRKSEKMALFVATAGLEYEAMVCEIKEEGDSIKLFTLDSIGTCIAEATGNFLEEKLQQEIGELKHTNRFSPGYCGWNVTEQKKLFALLPANVCKVTLTDSNLMFPIKSISGCIGIGTDVRTDIYSCGICDMSACFRKRKSFKQKSIKK